MRHLLVDDEGKRARQIENRIGRVDTSMGNPCVFLSISQQWVIDCHQHGLTQKNTSPFRLAILSILCLEGELWHLILFCFLRGIKASTAQVCSFYCRSSKVKQLGCLLCIRCSLSFCVFSLLLPLLFFSCITHRFMCPSAQQHSSLHTSFESRNRVFVYFEEVISLSAQE